MTGLIRRGRMLAAFLSVVLILASFGSLSASAQGRYYRRHHHGRARGALIGGTAGLVGGALLGGGKGALIGAGTGAGTGYMIQRYRNHHNWRRHHRNWRHRRY